MDKWEMPEWMEPFCEATFKSNKENVERVMNLRAIVRSDASELPLINEFDFKARILTHLYSAGFICEGEEEVCL